MLSSLVTENLHLAANVPNGTTIPLRSSVALPAQRLYRGPAHCISSILQTEGLQGLYRGAGAMILRDVPGYTLYFIPYTLLCDLLKPDGTSSLHPGSIWLAGGLAGKRHRMDVRVQTGGLASETPGELKEWSANNLRLHLNPCTM